MNVVHLQQIRATLPVHKQVELTSLRRGIGKNVQQTKLINETLARDSKEGQDIEMIGQKLGQIAHVSEERSDRMASKTVAQELRDILNAEQELKSADSSVSAKLHQNSVAEIVSATASHVGGRPLSDRWLRISVKMEKSIYDSANSNVCQTSRGTCFPPMLSIALFATSGGLASDTVPIPDFLACF